MMEFALKHPILTFLLVGSAIDGVVSIARSVSAAFAGKKEKTEVDTDEPANDIQ